jgi:hypothetical protein
MSIVAVRASFKNSRINPRSATTEADTVRVSVAGGLTNTLLLAADSSRTYVTVRNTSSTDNLRYAYSDDPNILTEGMLLKAGEAADLESPTDIYARSEAGAVIVIMDIGRG